MPETFRVPIQVDMRGRLATTTSLVDIIEQRITDLLVSYRGERVMRPDHGADLQGFLFSPMRDDMLGVKAQEVQRLLQESMTFGEIVSVTMDDVAGQQSTVRVNVLYRLTPGEPVRTFEKSVSGLVTEETLL